MILKLYFMRCLERKISQCILPLRSLWIVADGTILYGFNCIVKEGNYYANSKKFVLPSSLFMLELRAGCHSQLKMVSEVMANILAFVDHLCWLFTNFSSKKLHSKTASFYAYAIIFYAAVFSVRKNFTLIFFWLGNYYASSFPH